MYLYQKKNIISMTNKKIIIITLTNKFVFKKKKQRCGNCLDHLTNKFTPMLVMDGLKINIT
jgi:hypothetical protein